MRIGLGSDHAAIEWRAHFRTRFEQAGHQVTVLGPSEGESADYPDVAHPLATALAASELDRVLLICGSGQGMAMTANKVPSVRAAVVSDPVSAALAMAHNDARVLCIGSRIIGLALAEACVDAWIEASFEGGRHQRRVGKIEPSNQVV